MKITQYMEPMLLCTAFYLLIGVTFSTPTDVHINNPKRSLLGGSNSVPTRLIRAELPRLRIYWRRLRLEKFGRLRSRRSWR